MARLDGIVGTPANTGHFYGAGTHYVVQTATALYAFTCGESVSTDLVYRKSTDGGLSWGNHVTVSSTTLSQLAIWYDPWSGLAGGLIHCAYTDSATHDVLYRSIDTASSDTLSAVTTVYAGASVVTGAGYLSIARARGGDIYVAYDIDGGTETGFVVSTDTGATWSAALANPNEAVQDFLILLPGWAADNQDMMAFFWDHTANEISRKLYDDSLNSWSETSIAATMIELGQATAWPNFAAAVDTTNSRNLLVAWSNTDTLNADLRCWHITEAAITEVTNVVLNSTDDQGLCGIAIDTTSEKWTVVYAGKSDGSEAFSSALNLYYKESTDSGATWGAETLLTTSSKAIKTIELPMRYATDLNVVYYNGATFPNLYCNSPLPASGTTAISGDQLMRVSIPAGSTGKSLRLRIVDSTTGAAETGVTSATGGLDLKYRRTFAATANLTEADLGALDTPFTPESFKHIGAGYYDVHVPNAALAIGADSVLFFGSVTDMIVMGCEVDLTEGGALTYSGVATAGGTTTVTLPSGADALTDNIYQGWSARIKHAGLTAIGTLAIDANPIKYKTTTTAAYRIAGLTYTDAAETALVFSANHVITANLYGCILIQVNAAGTPATKVASATQGYASAALALAALPVPDSGYVKLGHIAIANNAGDWTANTDNLTNGGHVTTATFVDGDLIGGVEESRTVASYVASTKVLTLDTATKISCADEDEVYLYLSPVGAALADIASTVHTTAMTESYNSDGSAATLAQALYLIMQRLTESSLSGTTLTVKKLDGSTTAATFTLSDASNPTSVTRAT